MTFLEFVSVTITHYISWLTSKVYREWYRKAIKEANQ